MSTIAVTNVKHPSAVDPAIVLDAGGDVTYAGVHDFSAATVTGAPQGLVHIATESFSAVSSVSLNGVFTSAYANYIITGYLVGSENSGFGWRLRSGGTDNSTASSYKSETVYSLSTSVGGVNYNLSFWSTVGTTSSTVDTPYNMQILSPNLERQTSMLLTHAGRGSRIALCGGYHTATTAFDGITLLSDTGTISGIIRVYGYANS